MACDFRPLVQWLFQEIASCVMFIFDGFQSNRRKGKWIFKKSNADVIRTFCTWMLPPQCNRQRWLLSCYERRHPMLWQGKILVFELWILLSDVLVSHGIQFQARMLSSSFLSQSHKKVNAFWKARKQISTLHNDIVPSLIQCIHKKKYQCSPH